jgi:hypothetical protein
LIGKGDAPDGNQKAAWERRLHRHPRGRLVCKELGKELVELLEVGRVSDKDGRIDHQLRTAAACAEHGTDVLQCLPGLLREGACSRLRGRGIHPWLTRHDKKSPARTAGE